MEQKASDNVPKNKDFVDSGGNAGQRMLREMIERGMKQRQRNGCACATPTDEWHGWECSISGGACMFLIPNARVCAEMYGEGPYAENTQDAKESEALPHDVD